MKRSRTWLLILAVVLGGGLAGHWIARQAAGPETADTTAEPSAKPVQRPLRDSMVHDPKSERGPGARFSEDSEALDAGAIANQRTVTFSSAEALAAFLKKIEGKGIAVLGRIDALNTLRLGFLSLDELRALLEGDEELGMIFPAYIPGQGSVQAGAVGFGDLFLEWLGIQGDRSQFGANVRIAVLDTGIFAVDAFGNTIARVDYVERPGDLTQANGHGSSVAALIAGQLGLSPGASLLDFRVANDNGVSNTFTLAQAVLDAVSAGADVINISLGSRGFSQILENALQIAYEAGVMVVTSTGNEGLGAVSYPASSQYTIAVGAIEARGDHLDFSNSGEVSMVAPGLALGSIDQNGNPIYFTGTSASTPVVAGAITLVMSAFDVTAGQAWQILLDNANEAGAPGYDAQYGEGILDVGRALDSKTPGIVDAAVASNYITTDSQGNAIVQVTVENRGTETITNAPLQVTTPAGSRQASVSHLAPGEIKTFTFPLGATTGDYTVDSSVTVSRGADDRNPQNNQRVDSFTASDSP